MKLLKFFLYVILFGAIGWSFLIFGGPSFLAWATASYSDGRVKLKNIKISPSLQITVGRVEFDFGDEGAQISSFGLSKSVNFDWSLFDDNALAKLRMGPTVLKNLGRAESVEIEIPSYSNLNLSDLSFAVSADGVELDGFAAVESISISGKLKNNFRLLADGRLIASNLETFDPVASVFNSTNARISDIKMNVPLVDQEIVIDLLLNQGSIGQYAANADKIKSTITSVNSEFVFGLDFGTILIDELSGVLRGVKASGKYRNGNFINPFLINISGGAFMDGDIKLVGLDAEILNTNKNAYSANAQLEFSAIKIDTADKYIGELPANKIKFNVGFDAKTSEVVARSRMVFKDPDLAKISGSASFNAELGQSKNSSGCNPIICSFNSLVLNYQVNFGKENFTGRSSCSKLNCDLKSMSHNLVTSNTAKVFESLQNSKIFNPLLSIYFYSAISAGKKIGKGHEIIIN